MIPHVNDGKEREAVQNSTDYNALQAKKVTWYHQVMLNRPSKVTTIGLIFAIVTPLLLYHYLYYHSLDVAPPDGFSTGSCLLPRSSRLPCGLGSVNDTDCHRQCCYDYELNVCFHRFPSRFSYILNEEWTENLTLTPRISTVPFKRQESSRIQVSVSEITPTHLSITFYDPEKMKVEGRNISDTNYTYYISGPELSVIVNDTNGNNMFSTTGRPIVASENIWELAFKLTDEAMYGLGEIPLIEGNVKVLYNHKGGFNSIPLIFSKVNDSYHGLLIDVVEPTEVRIEGDNQVVVRSITKRGIKLHLFAGPEPKDIMREVMDIIGLKPELEYWMLGPHICSENTAATDVYDDLVKFTTEATKEKIPYESHCGVEPVIFHDDCEEKGYREHLVKSYELIKSLGKRFVPHVSPYIFYTEANSNEETETIEPRSNPPFNCSNVLPKFEDLILRTADWNEIYKGTVDNKTVFYPDYEIASAEFFTKLWDGPAVDGLVLENSWPVDDSFKFHNETRDILPYLSENFEAAFNITPQWDIKRPNNETYIYTHNLYGNHFAEAFRLTSIDRVPILTTSQWMTGEIVNRQNIDASWTNLHKELVEAALGGVSGHWLWTSPICGDTNQYDIETQAHLCVKWYMAATFLPLIKIHSKEVQRHPLAFTGTNRANILKGLNHRYSFMSYFYTILQTGPLLRPMFYQFPFSEVIKLKTQFSVGEDLLIVPNLQPSQSHVHVYMPPGHWYEFWSGIPIEAEEGEAVTMTTTDADFLVLIRAGAIVVTQQDFKETAEATRLSDIYLTIALDCEEVSKNKTEPSREDKEETITICRASGELYMNEEMTVKFEADSEKLTVTALGKNFQPICDMQGATWAKTVKELNVFGLDAKQNNYDHHKNVVAWAELCQLQSHEQIVVPFA